MMTSAPLRSATDRYNGSINVPISRKAAGSEKRGDELMSAERTECPTNPMPRIRRRSLVISCWSPYASSMTAGQNEQSANSSPHPHLSIGQYGSNSGRNGSPTLTQPSTCDRACSRSVLPEKPAPAMYATLTLRRSGCTPPLMQPMRPRGFAGPRRVGSGTRTDR